MRIGTKRYSRSTPCLFNSADGQSINQAFVDRYALQVQSCFQDAFERLSCLCLS